MAARKQESETITQETEKRKLDEGLDDGELSTDSEFEAPRKLQKTVKHDKVNVSASTEVNSSTYVVDESRKTDIETKETEVEGETTLTDDNVDSDDDLDDNEIYAWQEKGIEKQGTKPVTTGSQEDEEAYIEKEKIILKGISIL